ncbi:MAG: hypothetical protein Ta2G_18240 [Termitinemataceae bacterium]|nr:MAG: hypothetical protein Ta2G_18240 [Termitinemataceae bacterium]
MNDEKNIKIEDCVKFKHDLHEKLFKKSGANNLREYIFYVNNLHKEQFKTSGAKTFNG